MQREITVSYAASDVMSFLIISYRKISELTRGAFDFEELELEDVSD
jgi:hypothetical protein